MKIKIAFGLATIALILAACNGTDFQKTKGGAPYKIISDNKGQKIDSGNIVKFQLIQKIKDSVLYSTYTQTPRYERVIPGTSSYDPMNIIMDVLMHARKGDSIYISMALDSFIKQDPTILQKTPFKKGDLIVTTIRVVDVFKNPDDAKQDMEKANIEAFNKDAKIQEQKKKDEKVIEDYLATNHIQAQKTTWGAYVQILAAGQGPKPAAGEYVMLRYTGTDLAGKIFDTNTTPGKPLLPLQIGTGGSIIGFEDGVKELSKGSKAKIFVPSVIGYGQMGSPPVIQPNENLVFEVEVVDITKTPPQQQQMPQPIDTGKHK